MGLPLNLASPRRAIQSSTLRSKWGYRTEHKEGFVLRASAVEARGLDPKTGPVYDASIVITLSPYPTLWTFQPHCLISAKTLVGLWAVKYLFLFLPALVLPSPKRILSPFIRGWKASPKGWNFSLDRLLASFSRDLLEEEAASSCSSTEMDD
ncbi:hypothetical protein HNY73_007599 [Argiope bruennichi]|uniref:Uncharacterized protein n=1 Tax=Argiope bruennichi TaxID=94029 RepID=A0A8T0FEE4_ARGBR|nr:hypothetical protein HNY73_007599 [Argiope bruennichi]